MEKQMRRNVFDLYVALSLSSIVVVGLAVLFANTLLVLGAVLTVCGAAFLAHEVLDHRRRAPAADNGAAPSLEYHRAFLRHQLAFYRKGVWFRMLVLAPGGVLFFIGFAVARPDLALLIDFQLATFAVAIIVMVPANRRAAAKLERRIHELEQLP